MSKARMILTSSVFYQFLASLGVVLFEALDYGYDEHEERSLDPSLESLIERLTSADSVIEPPFDGTVDDEGIERDAGEEELNSLNDPRSQIITLETALEVSCLDSYTETISNRNINNNFLFTSTVRHVVITSSYRIKLKSITGLFVGPFLPKHKIWQLFLLKYPKERRSVSSSSFFLSFFLIVT